MNTISKALIAVAFVAAHSLVSATPASPDDRRSAMQALDWKKGPTSGALGDKATIQLPAGVQFLEEKDGIKFLELSGNLPESGNSILATNDWWAAFTFSPVGYVKDDEKIDADALLKSMKANDKESNDERRKHGLPELYTDGWYVPPHYDEATKHLEWGLRLRSSDSPTPVVNYTVRLLGRTGYESVVLVSSPETLDADVQAFKAMLKGFEFKAGERYSEFKPGDHVAEIGLAALVAGGAAAVAVKTGFWKVILGFLAASWKLVAAAGVAVVVGLGKLFGRKDSK